MEPTIYKPSIYKGAGIYKTGAAGGGGGNFVEIKGTFYEYVKIGSLFWMTRNLVYIPNSINLNPNSMRNDACAWTKDINGLEVYYNGYVPSVLANEDLNGFRVPSDADFENLKSASSPNSCTKLKSLTTWNSGTSTNEFGFNAKAAGYIDSMLNLVNASGTTDYWTSNQGGGNDQISYWFGANINEIVRESSGKDQAFSIRLCKDA